VTKRRPDEPDGTPKTFTWRGKTYHVEVLSKWHLQDRWWELTPERGRSNRYYVRVATRDHMVFELFADVAHKPAVWVLDIVHD
jgi:hypothetical protein